MCGIRDSVVCKKLLTIDALMLDVALKTAAAQEAVDREAAGLASGAGHVHALTQSKTTKPKPGATDNARREKGDCYRCGGTDHDPSKCRFKAAECHHCHKRGHLSRVCRQRFASSQSSTLRFVTTAESAVHACHPMTECVNEVHSRQWTVEIDVNGRSTELVIDTGASVTLMPRKHGIVAKASHITV